MTNTDTLLSTPASIKSASIKPVSCSDFAPASLAAVGFAAAALLGRLATFLVAGPSSLNSLLILLLVAVSALVAVDGASMGDDTSKIERTMVRFAKRIATVQVVIGLGLIVLHLT